MIGSRSLGSAGSAVQLLNLTAATNATPIVITLDANSGLGTGSRIAIAGVTGNTGANGTWTLDQLSATTFQLRGSIGNGTYGGTPRVGVVFDQTPVLKNENAVLIMGGNGVGTLLLESFGSYDEFAAGNNSQRGPVPPPVSVSSFSFVTNTTASIASASVLGSSSVVIAAAQQNVPLPVKLPFILRASISAYTSGSFFARLAA